MAGRRKTQNRRHKGRRNRRHTRRLSRRNLKYIQKGGNIQANPPYYYYPMNTNTIQYPISTTNPPIPQKGGIGSFGITNLLQGAVYNANTLNAISNAVPVSSVSSPYPFY